MYRHNQHIHFVGIGGIGMSGIAELLLHMGYRVSGSDLRQNDLTRRLADLGGQIHTGHDARWIEGADVVVTSSAVRPSNPEVMAATAARIPVVQRAEMLAELMRLKHYGIAVAGSHGKTSTTSMVAEVLRAAQLDPTVVVGGQVLSFGGCNAHLGAGEFLVAEADESDGSFLKLSPVIEVVTNIDLEHLDYYRDLDHIKDVFLAYIERLPFYGLAVLCIDDPQVSDLLPQISRRVLTYGLSERAELRATDLHGHSGRYGFTVVRHGQELGAISLNRPGRHLVYNSLAAVGVGLELDIPFAIIAEALGQFRGVKRRLQSKGEAKQVLVIDDYGHHPTEIQVTLEALREGWPDRRLVTVFQPHRYTRTQALLPEFIQSFAGTDVLVCCDIYAASEEPIPGISGQSLAEAVQAQGQAQSLYLPGLPQDPSALLPLLQPGDLVLTLGAGSIGRLGDVLLAQLQAQA